MWIALGEYRGYPCMRAFMRYALARARRRDVDMAFMLFVTESLRLAPQGKCIGIPFRDIVCPKPDMKPEEVARGVIEKGGLEVVEG